LFFWKKVSLFFLFGIFYFSFCQMRWCIIVSSIYARSRTRNLEHRQISCSFKSTSTWGKRGCRVVQTREFEAKFRAGFLDDNRWYQNLADNNRIVWRSTSQVGRISLWWQDESRGS
jgi:hypothetical protein